MGERARESGGRGSGGEGLGFLLLCFVFVLIMFSLFFLFIFFPVLNHFKLSRHFIKMCLPHHIYLCKIWHLPNIFVLTFEKFVV